MPAKFVAQTLNFHNELPSKLRRLKSLITAKGLDTLTSKSVFVELDQESRKENDFFDKYLRKRRQRFESESSSSADPTNQPISGSIDIDVENEAELETKVEAGTKAEAAGQSLIETCILSEFRMCNISKKLSKHQYRELYSLVHRSTRFILNGRAKKKTEVSLNQVADIVSNVMALLLSKS
ncbi:hypothetical protein FOA43_000857 [Brettanomyces nanus]|uniref:Sld7 C-terminal domain-containing protein n=1 Tax=Eeniella nana TaxID=13502 RepID=A0A875RZS3_EENNA|nr:uncharacterized protein FOA43_000857 [Brettanomyces nanus]QPG73545.1 hypothetical protein FOA43_000857 [Brettanomyces nanus]